MKHVRARARNAVRPARRAQTMRKSARRASVRSVRTTAGPVATQSAVVLAKNSEHANSLGDEVVAKLRQSLKVRADDRLDIAAQLAGFVVRGNAELDVDDLWVVRGASDAADHLAS